MDATAVSNASYSRSDSFSNSDADVVNEGADVSDEGASYSDCLTNSNSISRPSTFSSRSDSNP